MNKVRMTREQMEALTTCRDCRHFHRYRVQAQLQFRAEDLPEDQVELWEGTDTYYRCLVGAGQQPLMDLTDCAIVDCNQFERCEAKKKL